MKVPDVQGMYGAMARACRGELRCGNCGTRSVCEDSNAAAYLRHGWPKCCGSTMRLVSEKELAAERARTAPAKPAATSGEGER